MSGYIFPIAIWALIIVRGADASLQEFNELSTKLTTVYVSEVHLKDGKYAIVFKVDNQTAVKWCDMKYQLVGKYDGKVSYVITAAEYPLWIQPNSEGNITIYIDSKPLISQWELAIKDLSAKIL
ncbi:MAG: hypothetical protein BM565_12955 [Gammaproteobacteria bacterium MedPE]|nr:MAG: hypothetical protein BM565_12955 [Gammaproteobacteria bacterium MedPE]